MEAWLDAGGGGGGGIAMRGFGGASESELRLAKEGERSWFIVWWMWYEY